jgi:hypothetical protein
MRILGFINLALAIATAQRHATSPPPKIGSYPASDASKDAWNTAVLHASSTSPSCPSCPEIHSLRRRLCPSPPHILSITHPWPEKPQISVIQEDRQRYPHAKSSKIWGTVSLPEPEDPTTNMSSQWSVTEERTVVVPIPVAVISSFPAVLVLVVTLLPGHPTTAGAARGILRRSRWYVLSLYLSSLSSPS